MTKTKRPVASGGLGQVRVERGGEIAVGPGCDQLVFATPLETRTRKDFRIKHLSKILSENRGPSIWIYTQVAFPLSRMFL